LSFSCKYANGNEQFQATCYFIQNTKNSKLGPVAGLCEHNDEPLSTIKGRKFLD